MEREIFLLQVICGIKQRALLFLNTNCFDAFINRVIFFKRRGNILVQYIRTNACFPTITLINTWK